MNKKQWIVFGIGLMIFGIFLINHADSIIKLCNGLITNELYMVCNIKFNMYKLSGLIIGILGVIFSIMGSLESKKKH